MKRERKKRNVLVGRRVPALPGASVNANYTKLKSDSDESSTTQLVDWTLYLCNDVIYEVVSFQVAGIGRDHHSRKLSICMAIWWAQMRENLIRLSAIM